MVATKCNCLWPLFIELLLATVLLSACSGGQAPERLAKTIEKNARGAVSLRTEHVAIDLTGGPAEYDVYYIERVIGLEIAKITDAEGSESQVISLRKKFCAGTADDRECARGEGLSVEFTISPDLVDPASITVSSPDEKTGETGYRVAFQCFPPDDLFGFGCLDFPEFYDHVGCAERKCDAVDTQMERAAEVFMERTELSGKAAVECRNQKACDETAVALRALTASLSGRPYIATLKQFHSTVEKIDRATRDAEQTIFDKGGLNVGLGDVYFTDQKRVAYTVTSFTAHPDGRLHIGMDICRKDADAVCAGDRAWEPSIRHVNLTDINPAAIFTPTFAQLRDTNNDVEAAWDGLGVQIYCNEETYCVENEGAPIASGWATLPCKVEADCNEIARAFSALAVFASEPAFETMTRAAKEATVIDDLKAAERIASALGRGFTDTTYDFYVDDFKTFQLKFSKSALSDSNELEIGIDYCVVDETCPLRRNPKQSTAVIDLNGVDADAVRIYELGGGLDGPGVALRCRADKHCIGMPIDGTMVGTNYLPLSCENYDACAQVMRDLRGLIAFVNDSEVSASSAAGNASSSDSAEDIAAPRNMRREIAKLNSASSGAEIILPVSGVSASRVLRGAGVEVSDSGALVVHRQACLALLASGMARGNECRVDNLFRDYDLVIDLSALDTRSLKVEEGQARYGASGYWVTGECQRQYACARLAVPATPSSDKTETEILMRSFVDSETAPRIRVPCVDRRACERAADALRALQRKAPNPDKKKSGARDGDFVGVWDFVAPYPNGWVTEFKKNGTFVFTNQASKVTGTFTAKDGQWSQVAPDFQYNESGTYRMLDANTLELTGRLGVSVWRRRP